MSQGTIQTLIPQTAYPGPPGTVCAITGLKNQAAAYYLANSDLQTISWTLGPGPQPNNQPANPVFIGNVYIQSSISTSPSSDADWITVYQLPTTPQTNNVQTGYYNLVGNYVWLRAIVNNWTQGPISVVSASY